MTEGNWVQVCALSDVGPGEMTLVEAAGAEIVVANVDGRPYAFDAICTHALGYLDQGELDGCEVLCPLHEGRFDVRTGEVTHEPPEEPLAVYDVRLVDGQVEVRVKE